MNSNLKLLAALYDDRSIRAHVHRTRDLLSLSTLHASLSTSLALQYENAQSKAPNSGGLKLDLKSLSLSFTILWTLWFWLSFLCCADAAKTDVPELDGLGFMEDVTGSLGKLLCTPSKEIKCVESIVFSSFNPPPSYRR